MTLIARKALNEDRAPPPVLNDCTREEAAEKRDLEALAGLFADASSDNQVQVLADNLAWALAHVAVNCGVGATGDILRTFGTYVCRLEARKQAEAEARQAREEGRLPN